MSQSRYLSLAEMNALQRRLLEYSQAYPDSDFLDSSLAFADSGRVFTRENAAKIADALANWERRLNAPSYDPDRCPPGRDPLTWDLATWYRDRTEAAGWPCMSRRIIYSEIARVLDRDKLRGNYSPWRDEPGAPGWYRMMRDVITAWTAEYTASNALATWYSHEQFAQPGEVTRIIGYLVDQAKTARLDARARPVALHAPAPGRRAAVKAWIAAREQQ